MASGAERELDYCVEAEWGTLPDPATWYRLRNTGGSGLLPNRSQLQSGEMRSDRGISDVGLGAVRPTLEVPFEFSYGSYEDYLESALQGAFAVAYALTNQTVSVDSVTNKFSRASGSFITDGVKVGDRITTTGFAAAGNNGTFVVSGVVALEITCATATGLVTVSSDTGVGITTDREVLKNGTTKKSFSIEDAYTDDDVYLLGLGMMVNTLSLSIQPDAMITGAMGLVGHTFSDPTAVAEASDVADVSTESPFDSYTGELKLATVATSAVTGIALAINNGLDPRLPVLSTTPHKMTSGRFNLTGTLTLFFEDATNLERFLDETEFALEFTLTDLSGNSYRFTMPRVKYTGESRNISEQDIGEPLPFLALQDTTKGYTLMIEKIPAAS